MPRAEENSLDTMFQNGAVFTQPDSDIQEERTHRPRASEKIAEPREEEEKKKVSKSSNTQNQSLKFKLMTVALVGVTALVIFKHPPKSGGVEAEPAAPRSSASHGTITHSEAQSRPSADDDVTVTPVANGATGVDALPMAQSVAPMPGAPVDPAVGSGQPQPETTPPPQPQPQTQAQSPAPAAASTAEAIPAAAKGAAAAPAATNLQPGPATTRPEQAASKPAPDGPATTDKPRTAVVEPPAAQAAASQVKVKPRPSTPPKPREPAQAPRQIKATSGHSNRLNVVREGSDAPSSDDEIIYPITSH